MIEQGDVYRVGPDCSLFGVALMGGDTVHVERVCYERRVIDVRILFLGVSQEVFAGGFLCLGDFATFSRLCA